MGEREWERADERREKGDTGYSPLCGREGGEQVLTSSSSLSYINRIVSYIMSPSILPHVEVLAFSS